MNRFYLTAVRLLGFILLSVVITPVWANVAPTVSLIAPANGSTYTAPASITFRANAADSDGTIAKVEFYSGERLLGNGGFSPDGWLYNWFDVPAGSYTLTAKAYDNAGAVTTSTAVAITVTAANVAPTVSLTSPSNGATFIAPASITLSANAADSNGAITKVEFYNGTTLLNTDTVAPYSYSWASVAAGSYTLTAKAYDNAGAVTTSTAVAITVTAANVAPTVSLTSPGNGATFVAPATITLSANAADSNGTIAKVEFYNGATLLNIDTAAPYSYSWASVAAGSYTLTAKAYDNAGAVTTSTAVAITVTAANVAPTVSLTSPSNGATFIAPASIALSANAADSNGTITKVEFYNGVTLLNTDITAPYSYIWTGVAAGNYALTAKAYDNAGALTTSTVVTVTVNPPPNMAPTVSLTSPANGATFTAPATINLAANAADSDGTISKIEFYNGSTLLNIDTAAPYSYIWSSVAAGSHTITAKAYDNAGAVTTSTAVTVMVNPAANIAPTVSMTGPPNGASYTAPASITLRASAQDQDGTISKVEFYSGVTLIGNGTLSLDGWFYSWTGVAAGSYTLTAKAYDNAGAVTTSSAVTITVNPATNVAPTVSLTSPVNGATFIAPATITLSANAADSNGTIAKVEFYNGATLLNTDTVAPYSYSWASVAAGSYTLTAKAYDNAGAVTTSTAISITVTAVNSPPSITMVLPINGATFTAPASISVSANASDSNGTISKVEFYNGATLLNTDTTSPYGFTWSSVGAGAYTLTAKATDNAGATTTSSPVSITVVAANALPTVSLTAPANGAKFSVGSNITLSANATDTDGSIAQVEFYAGATWLGVKSVPPYTVTWNAVPAGNHTLTAKATDNQGGIKISSAVAISVVAPVETLTYYHLDLQGSPAAATNASGAVVWKEAYRPYGERILKQDGGTNNQWFTGKIHDEATGLSYFGARWYDPAIGRFMGVDPQDFGEDNLHSFNRYAYGNNNPYKFVDPDGEFPVLLIPLIWSGGGAAVSGAFNAAAQYVSTGSVQWGGVGGVADAAGDGAIMGPAFAPFAARGAAVNAGTSEVAGVTNKVVPNAAQQKNLDRFVDKIPANSKANVELRTLPNGGVAAQATSPARTPGWSAVYEKQIDAGGKTVQYTKTTYRPDGSIKDVKDKINGGTYP